MSDIKICVSRRIDLDSYVSENPLLYGVRCGAVYDETENSPLLGDNTGDNISERRMSFCEMTVQYWSWKNMEADYYGLFHYRRYFNFSKYRFPEDAYGSVVEAELTPDTEWVYGATKENMESLIEKYDVIIPEIRDISKFPEKYTSLRDHWNRAEHLYAKDLALLEETVLRMYPEYTETLESYFGGTNIYFCCMYIMKKEVFRDYCQWLYSILFELEKVIDIDTYTEEGQRTVGHLAERLMGLYMVHLKEQKPELAFKELQTVLFLDTKSNAKALATAFPMCSKEKIVPVVFAANDAFAAVSGVAIQSIIDNRNADYYYDIVVLESDITKYNKHLLVSLCEKIPEVSIRFFAAAGAISAYNLVANEHISVETYYRFLIQDILPDYDKVLYLDGDLICNTDVATLFETDMDGYMIGAAYDPDMIGQINAPNGIGLRYVLSELKLENPYGYFQAGVLVLNTKEMREAYTLSEWLTFASKRYKYSDQDVLNRYCHGRVRYLDMAWNVLVDCDNYRVPVVIAGAPGQIKTAYHEARKHPKVIHYAGWQKPWKMRGVDMEHYFWQYARHTPFYESLFLQSVGALVSQTVVYSNEPNVGVKGAVKIYMRKKANRMFPRGTKRRAIFAKIFFPVARWLR